MQIKDLELLKHISKMNSDQIKIELAEKNKLLDAVIHAEQQFESDITTEQSLHAGSLGLDLGKWTLWVNQNKKRFSAQKKVLMETIQVIKDRLIESIAEEERHKILLTNVKKQKQQHIDKRREESSEESVTLRRLSGGHS